MEIRNVVKQSEITTLKLLKRQGITIAPLVKVKLFTGRNKACMGLYRSGSIFRSGKPIIWINSEIEKTMEVYGVAKSKLSIIIEDTILHEYAHAIADQADLLNRMVGGTPTLFEHI